MTLFALLKGNTTFKDIFSWMLFNENNQILKDVFEKDKINIPSKSTYHRLLINTDNNALEYIFREFFFQFTTFRICLVGLAAKLHVETIAEFVASKEILDIVTKIGIDYAQGYHVGKPEPIEKYIST